MSKFFKKHFIHFMIFFLDAAFSYLHKTCDVYYDLECEEFQVYPRKDGVENETSCS